MKISEYIKNCFLNTKLCNQPLKSKITCIDDYHILIQVDNYEEMNKLFYGMVDWSIAMSKSQWMLYVEKKRPKHIQYVLFDFTKNTNDNKSIIGFTYNPKTQKFSTAHLKDNKYVSEEKLKEYIKSIGINIEEYLK